MNKIDILLKKAALWDYEYSAEENAAHRELLYNYTKLLISDLLQLQRDGTDVCEYYGVESALCDRRTSVIDLDVSDQELLEFMVAAHKQDITFNKFVINALERVIYDAKLSGLFDEPVIQQNDNDADINTEPQ